MTDVDRLAELAQDLVVRVRDEQPDSNARWLLAHTDEADRWALLFMLAAAVPDDRPWRHLTMWTYGTGGEDTDEATRARRRSLLEEVDCRVGSNQYGRKKRAA